MKKENKVRCPVCGTWNATLRINIPDETTYSMEFINQLKTVQLPCKKRDCKTLINI